ncbi:MAG: ABC transporter permease [Alphaproteobacteria bacterium]|nr:ABC transporter permease [Alphaproteobacteria bacterium]
MALFVLLRLLPGDPANALLGVGATDAQIAAARAQLGSDQPLATQFVQYLGNIARFDLGTSFVSRASVIGEIGNRMAVTVPLTLLGFLLALVIAIPLGIIAAVRAHTWYGWLISVVSQLGIAIPVFWLGILLVTAFSINLRWLPSGGFPLRGWQNLGEAATGMVLPVLTVALVMAASLLRYVRAATLDVLGSDFLRTARALGSGFAEALLRHGLRNGAVPVISILGIELASTFLGAVVVERVFSLPGLGSMLLLAIQQRDYPNLQGVLIVSTLLVLLIGFFADLLQRLIDPRLRDRARGAA